MNGRGSGSSCCVDKRWCGGGEGEPRRGEIGLFVDGFHEALESAEEGFGTDERRFKVDGTGEFVDCEAVSLYLVQIM